MFLLLTNNFPFVGKPLFKILRNILAVLLVVCSYVVNVNFVYSC